MLYLSNMDVFVKDRYGNTINLAKKYAIQVNYKQYPNIWIEWKRYKTIFATLNALSDLKKRYSKDGLIFRAVHKQYEL